MSNEHILSGPKSKIKRADRHIDELRQRTVPLDRSLYEITNDVGRRTVLHVHPDCFCVTYRPKENIPQTLAGIIGDTVGNLRAALDHLANGIVRTWGTPAQGPLYFPLAPRKDLITHSGLTAIEKALPGSEDLLLKKIRPENGPNEHFWDFYTLNKDDKHNFFVPTIVATTVSGLNARIGSNIMHNSSFGFNAASPAILIRSDSPVTMENNFQTAVEVKFGQGTPFENELVIPTLTQISQVVAETVSVFGRLIEKTKGI